jgi:hypothetical protein
MAHFAKLSPDNIVVFVTKGRDEDENSEEVLSTNTGDVYKRTSYNTYGGKHMDGGVPFRKNFAGVGFQYDAIRDAFIPPKPFSSWVLNEDTCLWDAPHPKPNTLDRYGMPAEYGWDEESLSWIEIDI